MLAHLLCDNETKTLLSILHTTQVYSNVVHDCFNVTHGTAG